MKCNRFSKDLKLTNLISKMTSFPKKGNLKIMKKTIDILLRKVITTTKIIWKFKKNKLLNHSALISLTSIMVQFHAKEKIFKVFKIVSSVFKGIILSMNMKKIVKTNISIIKKKTHSNIMNKIKFITKKRMITSEKISQFSINRSSLTGPKEIRITSMNLFNMNSTQWENQAINNRIDIRNSIMMLDLLKISGTKNLIKIIVMSQTEVQRC